MSRSLLAHAAYAFVLLALPFASGTLGATPPDDPQRGSAPINPREPGQTPEAYLAAEAQAAALSGILTPSAIVFDEAGAAGLPKNSKFDRLTLEQAYTLALIRSRAARSAKGEKPALTLEPKRLAELAEQYQVRDFDRFRQDFLSREGFDDPFAGFIDLLVRLQEVENTRRHIATLTRYFEVFRELAKGESSGLTQRHIDQIDSLLQRAYSDIVDREAQYRDALDAYKVQLGLPPSTPAVPDRALLAKFRDTFDTIDLWSANPTHKLTDLPRIITEHIPMLEDVRIDGRSLLDVAGIYKPGEPIPADPSQQKQPQPDKLGDLLTAAVRLALQNQRNAGGAKPKADSGHRLELRVRGQVRRLVRVAQEYEIEKRCFVLAIRQKDQAAEQLIAPPVGGGDGEGPVRLPAIPIGNILSSQAAILASQDRLVALWAEYQAGRMALHRDLGMMPFTSWDDFRKQFTPPLPPPKPQRKEGPFPPAPPPLPPPPEPR
jgi:hypothetical protein